MNKERQKEYLGRLKNETLMLKIDRFSRQMEILNRRIDFIEDQIVKLRLSEFDVEMLKLKIKEELKNGTGIGNNESNDGKSNGTATIYKCAR